MIFNIDDREEEEVDAMLEQIYEAMRKEMKRDKTMVLLPDGMMRLTKMIKNIRFLLDEDLCEYTISTEWNESFPKDVSIIVHSDSFGASPANDHVLNDIMSDKDGFDSEWMPGGKVLYHFGLSDIFTEAEMS